MKNKLTTQDLAYIAIAVVIMAVCSWISIPAAVPFTLQTFAVFCVLGLLGGRKGTIAIVVYILIGAIGIPVFSGFSGGIAKLLGPTGGYIIGFVASGLIYWATEALSRKNLIVRIIVMIAGLAVCYAFGTAWFITVYTRNTGAVSLATALAWCVIPFIIPDLVKIALAVVLSDRIKKAARL